ncbi:non-ribosomal peptide synthetase [Streptomyces sp. ID05-26A]|nr:non-ribosomal peptide synthetase [Streptomyces sp. ID05-26A]
MATRNTTAAEALELHAAARPTTIAISGGDGEITYAELDRRANQLAHELRSRGVDAEVPVALLVRRSARMIVLLVAVLKAGGAYVALDRRMPDERRRTILRDVRPALVITDDAPGPEQGVPSLSLDELWESSAQRPDTRPETRVGAENTAYIAYTSGSSGAPKGVLVPHRGITRLVVAAKYLPVGPDDVFLHLAPVAFDASTLEIWGALLNGAKLVVAPDHDLSLAKLTELVRANEVTVLWLTAGLFHQVVESGLARELRGVRLLLAGGDVLSVEHVNSALDLLGDTTLINGYGPTENTTFTCCEVLTEHVAERVPIGQPIDGTVVHVLDDAGDIAAEGLIFAAGGGLAHGYLNDPRLTAERFVPNPFAGVPGDRMYRTGDLGRRRPDGGLDFLGREDLQVKIRGFRIEPGEVEHALRTHPDLVDAVVTTQSSQGERRLVGFYVADEPVVSDHLRKHLGEVLPSYLIPTGFVWLEALPLTANGKVDRKALAAHTVADRGVLSSDYRPPGTLVESWLARLWADLTQVNRVGVHDDFFELGGHSLMAVRIIMEISDRHDVEVDPQDFYQHPTIAELADLIAGGIDEDR